MGAHYAVPKRLVVDWQSAPNVLPEGNAFVWFRRTPQTWRVLIRTFPAPPKGPYIRFPMLRLLRTPQSRHEWLVELARFLDGETTGSEPDDVLRYRISVALADRLKGG